MPNQSPRIERALQLTFVGDWGQANFHRFCGWLCQEVCDRAGRRSRVAILSIRDGGIDALNVVQDGEAHMAIATPTGLLRQAITGQGMFSLRALPNLRALATLPQNDRMLMAIAPGLGLRTFEELRAKKPPLRIATTPDDGASFIGYVAARLLEAHGVDRATLESWGGSFIFDDRPDQCLARFSSGEADAVVQEAIMTPWWGDVIDRLGAVVLPAEPHGLARLQESGIDSKPLPADYWSSIATDVPAVDFSDFVFFVRDDLPEDVAHLLTWCLVETRDTIERQYSHIPARHSGLTYPLMPREMAKTPFPLHPGAARYYREAGHLG